MDMDIWQIKRLLFLVKVGFCEDRSLGIMELKFKLKFLIAIPD